MIESVVVVVVVEFGSFADQIGRCFLVVVVVASVAEIDLVDSDVVVVVFVYSVIFAAFGADLSPYLSWLFA